MKLIKTKGIIIAEKVIADFDKIVTILTPNNGKIECMAKGARRPKSLLMAGTQFLCFGDYLLYKSNNTYNMNSCETIKVFYNIRTDLDKLEEAVEINKIVNAVTTENQNSYKILQLFLNTLYAISETNKDLKCIKAVFKIRLASIIGFRPIIEYCTNCKTTENLNHFSFKDSGFKCAKCAKEDKGAVEITNTTRDLIKYIIKADAKKILSFEVSKEVIKELEIISDIYLKEKIEKEY